MPLKIWAILKKLSNIFSANIILTFTYLTMRQGNIDPAMFCIGKISNK